MQGTSSLRLISTSRAGSVGGTGAESAAMDFGNAAGLLVNFKWWAPFHIPAGSNPANRPPTVLKAGRTAPPPFKLQPMSTIHGHLRI